MDPKQNKYSSRSFWAMPVNRLFINRYRNSTEGYTMPAEHAHDYYEMVFNFSSVPIRYTVSGREYEMTTPSFSFRAPYVLHSVNTTHTYTRTMLAFHPCILEEYANVLDLGRLWGRQECTVPRTEDQMNQLHQLLSRMQLIRRTGPNEKAFICLLGALLQEVSALLPDEQPDLIPAPPYIQEMLHYIVEHTDENLTADLLSKKFFRLLLRSRVLSAVLSDFLRQELCVSELCEDCSRMRQVAAPPPRLTPRQTQKVPPSRAFGGYLRCLSIPLCSAL